MNKAQAKMLREAMDKIDAAKSAISIVASELRSEYEEMSPKTLRQLSREQQQEWEKGEQLEETISSLEELDGELDEVINALGTAIAK
jgi:hypothetical protein